MKKISIRNILILQAVFIIYSISSVVAKFASAEMENASSIWEVLTVRFIVLCCLEVLILGIYALLWQQVIKHFELSIAYANKAMTLLWGLLWGAVLFKEHITVTKVAGMLLVIVGIIVLNWKTEVTE